MGIGLRQEMFSMRSLWMIAALASFLLYSGSAVAFGKTDREYCSSASPELRIRGCTSLIASRKHKSADLALFYYNRGTAYSDKGNSKSAVDDFSRAIEINPYDARFFYNRGNERSQSGDGIGAIKDYDRAIEWIQLRSMHTTIEELFI